MKKYVNKFLLANEAQKIWKNSCFRHSSESEDLGSFAEQRVELSYLGIALAPARADENRVRIIFRSARPAGRPIILR